MTKLTRISIAAATIVSFSFLTRTALAEASKPGSDIDKAMTMFQGIGNRDAALATNGKIAEHWDTIQNIPPQNERKNQNGKF